MVRPAIINEKKKPSKKRKGNPGGKFQNEIKFGIEYAKGFGMRIPDKMNVGPNGQMIRMKGSTTPADFFYTNKKGVYLIESKTVKLRPTKTKGYTGSLDFSGRVDGHQKDALLEMSAVSGDFHWGYLAVKLWNGESKKVDKIHECYLLNIIEACGIIEETGLKSINQERIRSAGIRVPWVPSSSKNDTKAHWDIGGVLD